MKKKLYIYWISAEPFYPVCTAGAVVVAENEEEALKMCDDLKNPEKPVLVGVADKSYKEPQTIVSNNGDY